MVYITGLNQAMEGELLPNFQIFWSQMSGGSDWKS